MLFSKSVIQRLLSHALLHQWLKMRRVRKGGVWHCPQVDRGHHDSAVGYVALDVSIFSSGYRGGWTGWSQRAVTSHKLYGSINSEHKTKHSTNLKQKSVQWLIFPSKTYYIYFKTTLLRNYIEIWYKRPSIRPLTIRPRLLPVFYSIGTMTEHSNISVWWPSKISLI